MKYTLSASLLAFTALASGAFAESAVVTAAEKVAGAAPVQGIRAGGFLVIPKVDVDETYNDNIYATSRNETDDFITTIRPEITAKSNWNRHALNAVARGEFQRYADKDTENQNNYLFAADGRVDVLRDTSIGGGIAFARDHEERGNPNTAASAAEPTEYQTTTAKIGAFRSLSKLNARVDSEAKKLDYKNNYTTAGTLIDSNSRDRMEYTQSARLGYQFDPRFEAFVKGDIDARVYDRKGGTSTNRSSHGQRVVVGSTFDMTGKTKGEVYVGSINRNYVDPALKDIDGLTWGGKATWNASELTTVIAGIDRSIEETTLANSAGYLSTAYTGEVQHALTRNVLLKAGAGWINNDYEGRTGTQREDDELKLNAGAAYNFNRCLKAGLDYSYTDRDSNIAGGDFTRNAVMLRLTGSY